MQKITLTESESLTAEEALLGVADAYRRRGAEADLLIAGRLDSVRTKIVEALAADLGRREKSASTMFPDTLA